MFSPLKSFIKFSTCVNYFQSFSIIWRGLHLQMCNMCDYASLGDHSCGDGSWKLSLFKGYGAIEITGILKRIFYGEFWKQGTGFLAFELLESSSFKRKLDDWLVSFWVIGVFLVQEKVGWPHHALSDFSSAHFFTCYNSLACFAL